VFRYKLRTLLIGLALGPPVIAGAWWAWERWRPLRQDEMLPHYGGGPTFAEQPDTADFPPTTDNRP